MPDFNLRDRERHETMLRRRSAIACGLLMLLVALSAAGCSRMFWRQNADREVYSLLPGKMQDPRWAVPHFDITPDVGSRHFDPYPPDKGPLPPDDAAAHEYMYWVNGIRQSKSWHKFGTALSIENPHWLAPFGLAPAADGGHPVPLEEETTPPPAPAEAAASPGGEIVLAAHEMQQEYLDLVPTPSTGSRSELHGIEEEVYAEGIGFAEECPVCLPDASRHGIEKVTLQQALELSYIHSREYQFQIEELYLAALDLTFDRFRFNVRYLGFGGREPTSDLTFESIPREQNSLTMNNRFGVSQLLPAGGQWIVELANSTVWLFAGPNQTNTASVLSYSLVQPLLMGAGRKVVLEGLTQRERNTLYAARDLARFRQTFFADVVGGSGPGGGFLGILQQTQALANQQNNIRQLEQQVELLRTVAEEEQLVEISEQLPALPPGFEIPPELQGQLRFDPETMLLYWRGEMSDEQEQILLGLSDDADFQTAANALVERLQTETVTLDVAQLETDLATRRDALNDAQRQLLDSLDRFKIQLGLPPDLHLTIDDSLLEQFTLIEPRLFALERQITDFVEVWARLDDEDPDLTQLRVVAAGLKQLQESVRRDGLTLIDRDVRRVDDNMDERLGRLDSNAEREAVRRNVERDRRLFSSLRNTYSGTSQRLDRLIVTLEQDDVDLEARQQARSSLGVLREQLLKAAQELQVIQANLRVELISLQRYEIGQEESVAIGLENRFDLMNARAQVMDARRRQEVAANQLEAMLDIVAEGDVRTPVGTNPFDFRGRRSSFRVGARFTAPLDQIAERNDYRASLIDYQRARRNYMALEDQVKFSIRQNWRQLQVLNQNFEIARQALRSAATQLDLAVENATAPSQPGQPQRQATGQQGLNLLNALDRLLRAQNNLIGIWVNYERSRINIYREMGMMDVDPRGVWNDEFYQQPPPSSPPESHDAQQQLGEPAALRGGDGAGRPFFNSRRAVRRRDGGELRAVADGGQRRDSDGRSVRAADEEFRLPRKIDVEEAPADGAAAGDRGGRVLDVPEFRDRPDEGVPQPGDRSRQTGPVFHRGDR